MNINVGVVGAGTMDTALARQKDGNPDQKGEENEENQGIHEVE